MYQMICLADKNEYAEFVLTISDMIFHLLFMFDILDIHLHQFQLEFRHMFVHTVLSSPFKYIIHRHK